VCASQQDTGEERDPPQPHVLSPPSSRTPKRSYILLTFRGPRRSQPSDGVLPGEDQVPASGLVSASELQAASEPPTSYGPGSVSEAILPSEPLTASEPVTATEPLTASERPLAADPPQRLAQAKTFEDAGAGRYSASLLDASLIVIGSALFLCALATISFTRVWSWHAGSARTFNLSHMHGICTSAMGELAQGASSNVASHCLWVDGTWTEAVALAAGGCILAVIGIARIVGALRRPA
jgi:hypothetical protein